MARIGRPPVPVWERVWQHITIVDDASSCWPWNGVRQRVKGQPRYGLIRPNGQAKTKVYAHRVVWEALFGPIPPGMEVCHKCDNEPCCRPTHFFLDTQAGNLADMRAKGRGATGERHGRAKLTGADVLAIRRAEGKRVGWLAKEYGLSHSTISNIRTHKTWQTI